MKVMILKTVRVIAMLGITTIILSSLLLMKQSKWCGFDRETNKSLEDSPQTREVTLTQTTWSTSEQSSSAFRLLGYANLTLMKQMGEERPNFEYLLEPWKTKCSDDAADGKNVAWSMIVVVKSSPDNVDRRQVIRGTWGSYKYTNDTRLEVLFVVGFTKNREQQNAISLESGDNGDILQINKTEEYKDVGLKTISGMQWVTNHCQSNWIYASSDDDMMPLVVKFYRMFESQGVRKMAKSRTSANRFPIICNFSLRAKRKPIREQKRKNNVSPEIYSAETYPTFCAGGFYSMSVEICKILFHLSRSHQYFYNDDVWITGLLRLAAIDAGYIPCDDITDESCAISTTQSYAVGHFYGNIKKMMKFWKEASNGSKESATK